MLAVTDIISKIRTTVHDEQETGYEDSTLLGYINDAMRVLWRTVTQMRPEILAAPPIAGTLEAGQSSVTLEDMRVFRVVRVTAGNKILQPCRIETAEPRSGEPTNYFMTGLDTFHFYPVPTKETDYSIIVIPDVSLLDMESRSPFPLAIDDFLYEYVSARASISNEYDMSQETALTQMINGQVEDYLRNLDRKPIFTESYWGGGGTRRTNRRWW